MPLASFFCRKRQQAGEKSWGHPNPRQGRCPWTPFKTTVACSDRQESEFGDIPGTARDAAPGPRSKNSHIAL
ncbi:MAG TPA: hypothetical protein VFN35_26535, partial [Ktedonobacteraceae bacterium]|nr:hypothetical protein [Ktedonobacteraceae bacterium]